MIAQLSLKADPAFSRSQKICSRSIRRKTIESFERKSLRKLRSFKTSETLLPARFFGQCDSLQT